MRPMDNGVHLPLGLYMNGMILVSWEELWRENLIGGGGALATYE